MSKTGLASRIATRVLPLAYLVTSHGCPHQSPAPMYMNKLQIQNFRGSISEAHSFGVRAEVICCIQVMCCDMLHSGDVVNS